MNKLYRNYILVMFGCNNGKYTAIGYGLSLYHLVEESEKYKVYFDSIKIVKFDLVKLLEEHNYD